MNNGVKYPEVKVQMVGRDGNAFAILGRVREAIRQAGLDLSVFDEYEQEATSGDYDNLLCVTMKWFDCE